MKKMSKWLLVALLVMGMLLTGCGKEKDVAGKVTPNESQNAAPSDTAGTEPEEKTVSLGRMEGGIYTNSYAGFGCELDSNWEFYMADELQELPENVQEMLADTELGDMMAQATQIMDMKAENVNDLLAINVLYTKLDTKSRVAYALMSEEDIMDVTLEQKDLLISSYAQAGIEVSSMEKVEVEFLGQKHFAIHTTASIEGIPYFMLQLYNYHAGSYGVTTTLSSYLEDNTDYLLSLFYKVD